VLKSRYVGSTRLNRSSERSDRFNRYLSFAPYTPGDRLSCWEPLFRSRRRCRYREPPFPLNARGIDLTSGCSLTNQVRARYQEERKLLAVSDQLSGKSDQYPVFGSRFSIPDCGLSPFLLNHLTIPLLNCFWLPTASRLPTAD